MSPAVKEVLALARRIDEAEKRRVAAAEEKATLTAQLEALIGIGAEPAPVVIKTPSMSKEEQEAFAASVTKEIDASLRRSLPQPAPRSKRMPAIQSEPEPGVVP